MRTTITAALLTCTLLACGGLTLDVGSNRDDGGTPALFPGLGVAPAAKGCKPAGATPVVLLRKKGLRPGPLVLDGTRLYLGGREDSDAEKIFRLSLDPADEGANVGVLEEITPYASGTFGVDDRRLAYFATSDALPRPPEGGTPTAIALREKDTGTVTLLSNPPSKTFVTRLRVLGSGVYWEAREHDAMEPSVLSRWDPASQKASALFSRNNAGTWVVDAGHVYFTRIASGNHVTLERAPIAGGGPEVIKDFGVVKAERFPEILGVDAEALYFTSLWDSGSIERMDKATRAESTILPASGQYHSLVALEGDAFYWVPGNDQATIMRLPKTGGTPARYARAEDTAYVQAYAFDACNVYWSTVNPPQIMAMSR